MHEQIAKQAELTPTAVAVCSETESLTYRELEHRANQLAQYLVSIGVQPGQRVALCLRRSPELLVSLLAILKAGATYVPLDPAHPPERLAFMLEDMQAGFLVTESALVDRLPVTDVNPLLLDQKRAEIGQQSSLPVNVKVEPEDLVYVIYTSGSTGQPKGTLVQHAGLTCYLAWACELYRVQEGTGSLLHSPLGFDLTVTSIFPPLVSGGKVVLVPEEQGIDALCRTLLRESNLSLLKITPAHLELLARQLPPEQAAGRTRALVVGGEALQAETLRFWRANAPQTRIINEYGPTETVVGCCIHEFTDADSPIGPVPIGEATPGTRLYLLDAEQKPVASGEVGELYIGGEQVTLGYLNRAELTAARFLPDPFHDQPRARMYRTGDLVRQQSDGRLVFIGRQDEQVKIRGYRIEPGEIESALNAAAGVRESLVVAQKNKAEEARLVAYIVPQLEGSEQGSHPLTQLYESLRPRLRKALQASLPAYMVPAAFVFLPEFPLTGNGKIDRRNLPAPGRERPALETAYVAPRNDVEARLAQAWAETLGIERVGVRDNFFELGGDSLQNIRIVSRARGLGLEITPSQIFRSPTIAQLALVAGSVSLAPRAEQGLVAGPLPFTPYFHWFFQEAFVDPQHWNMSLLLSSSESLHASHLESALRKLTQHHDLLRLRAIQTERGQWQAELAPDEPATLLRTFDLAEFPAEDRTTAMREHASRVQASLNLQAGPLVQAALFRFGAGEADRLLIVCHHLLVDGLSYLVLLEDLQAAYSQLCQRQDVSLPPKTTSFRTWAEKLAAWVREDNLQAETSHWIKAGSTTTHLPSDLTTKFVASADQNEWNRVADSVSHTVKLPPETTRTLLRDVPGAYNTHINDVLLTALLKVLRHWTGEAEVRIDMEGHGREELLPGVDVSRTVAGFTTIYPVLLQDDTVDDWGQSLIAVKEQMRAIPRNGIGYGLLRYLSPDDTLRRQLANQPRAELVFNYLGEIDQVLAGSGSWTVSHEPRGREFSKRTHRSYLIELNGSVIGGELHLEWIYAGRLFSAELIERLATQFIAGLMELIAHCLIPGVGVPTPSDFPLARLDRTSLAKIKPPPAKGAEIYPLSPLQEGMLFHWLLEPDSGVYCMQLAGTLSGDVNPEALQAAWQVAIDRHPALRTRLVWEGLARPLQVVEPQVDVPFVQEDWRALSGEEQTKQLAQRVHARGGYSLAVAPMMRLALIRLSDAGYRFIWDFHHAMLDGWSLIALLEEVMTDYRARLGGHSNAESLVTRTAPREHALWLAEQSAESAERYWRNTLAGFTTPTPLPGDGTASAENALSTAVSTDDPTLSPQGKRLVWLTAEDTEGLKQFAAQHQVTLNTLTHAAWAMQLSAAANSDDVLFGTIVPGRPADLPGADSMLGMFMNTLPVRVRLEKSTPLVQWLTRFQEPLLELRQFEAASLATIQRWSELRGGGPLLESLISVQGHLAAHASLADWGANLGLSDFHYIDWNSLPLSLAVEVGPRISILAKYDTRRFSPAAVDKLLAEFIERLRLFVSSPHLTLAQHEQQIEQHDTQRLASERNQRQHALKDRLAGARRRSVVPPTTKGS